MIHFIALIVSLVAILIDNVYQYSKEKKLIRIIFSIILIATIFFISKTWITERNEVTKIKDSISFFLSDKKFFTKIKSENELEEHLMYLQYNKNSSNIAIVEMLRCNELISETKKVTCLEFEKEYNLKFFFLSRQFVTNENNTQQRLKCQ